MKLWSKFALVLATGAMMFSSCIENIEPQGISDLRGAKAELLRAQTALQEAQAAKVEAEAALVLAQAKVQEAIAKQEEAKVAFIEAQTLAEQYKAEYQKLVNEAYAQEQADAHEKRVLELEQLIAEQEAAMAAAEQAALLAAEEFKISMLDVTQRLAEAQLAYDQALLDIELAKNTLTEEQSRYLFYKMDVVAELKLQVEELSYGLEQAADNLTDALTELDGTKSKELAVRRQQHEIAKAKAELEAAKEYEAEMKALLELDPDLVNWDAEAKKIKEELNKLEKEAVVKELNAAERAQVYLDSLDLLNGYAKEYTMYTGYDFNENTGLFSKIPGTPSESYAKLPEVYVPAVVDDEGNDLFDGAFALKNVRYTYGEEESVIEKFENRLESIAEKYNKESIEAEIALNEEALAAHKENAAYIAAMTRYNDAVAAYNAGSVLPYATKYVLDEDDDIEAAIKEYNDALTAFNAAIKAYEDAYAEYGTTAETEPIYDAYNEAIATAQKARAEAYQKAHLTKVDAEVAYAKALTKYENAVYNYNVTLVAAERAAGVSYAQMKSDVQAYDDLMDAGGYTPDEQETKKINAYKKYIESIEAAAYDTNAEDDAQSEFDAAEEAHNKALGDYTTACSNAEFAYGNARDKARLDRERALDELYAEGGKFNDEYQRYLYDEVSVARARLGSAFNLLGELANRTFADSWSETQSFDVYFADETQFVHFYRIPQFVLDGDLTANGQMEYSFVPVTLEDVQDLDYFLENVVRRLADNLTYYEASVWCLGYDYSGNFTEVYYAWLAHGYLNTNEGYPLTLPSMEDYKNFEAPALAVESYNSWAYAEAQQYIYDNYAWGNPELRETVGMALSDYVYEERIEELKSDLADLEKLPEFVAAIEAAQTEVEKFMAEKAAELDAMKADVEANYPRLLAEKEAVVAEAEVFVAKVEALETKLAAYLNAIDHYLGGMMSLEEFVEMLNDEYLAAVESTFDAEEDVLDAEEELEKLEAGYVTAVELAQGQYDVIAADLALAQALLDAAVKDLAEAVALIYDGAQLPELEIPEYTRPGTETPEPENPAPEAGEGTEETPAA